MQEQCRHRVRCPVVHLSFVFVCMYVCVYVCTHACMYVCIYVSMYFCMYACTRVLYEACPGGPRKTQLLAAQPRQLPPSPSGLAGQTILNFKYEEDSSNFEDSVWPLNTTLRAGEHTQTLTYRPAQDGFSMSRVLIVCIRPLLRVRVRDEGLGMRGWLS